MVENGTDVTVHGIQKDGSVTFAYISMKNDNERVFGRVKQGVLWPCEAEDGPRPRRRCRSQ